MKLTRSVLFSICIKTVLARAIYVTRIAPNIKNMAMKYVPLRFSHRLQACLGDWINGPIEISKMDNAPNLPLNLELSQE